MRQPCPGPQPECPYYETGCYQDDHHAYWPKTDYEPGIERTFRNLGCNVISLCRWTHEKIHERDRPPEKPSLEHMARVMIDNYQNGDNYTAVRKRKMVAKMLRNT